MVLPKEKKRPYVSMSDGRRPNARCKNSAEWRRGLAGHEEVEHDEAQQDA
jgi:hypothetical protein